MATDGLEKEVQAAAAVYWTRHPWAHRYSVRTMEGGERELQWLRTGGKLEENHFALSWGGLCGGSSISGAGRMIAGDSLRRWDGAGFQAQGLLPSNEGHLEEGNMVLSWRGSGKNSKEGRGGTGHVLGVLLGCPGCSDRLPHHNHCFPSCAENLIPLGQSSAFNFVF